MRGLRAISGLTRSFLHTKPTVTPEYDIALAKRKVKESSIELSGRVRLVDYGIAFCERVCLNSSSDRFKLGGNPDHIYNYASMDTILVAKNGLKIQAASAGCKIIGLFNKNEKLASIIHISPGGSVEKNIDILFNAFPEFKSKETVAIVLGDTSRITYQDEETEWHKSTVNGLEQKGIQTIVEYKEGDGKNFFLSSQTGGFTIYSSKPQKKHTGCLVKINHSQ